MSGCIVQCWFEVDHEDFQRRPHFSVIETEVDDFEKVCKMIEADQLIGGAVLWTRKDAAGMQVINKRQPIAFRGSAVMRVILPTWRFREAQPGEFGA